MVRLLQDLGAESVRDTVRTWLLQAEAVITDFPDTAGRLRPSYHSVVSYYEGSKATAIDLWSADTQHFWRQWGNYEVGCLIYCDRGHPYSKKSFHSCPECGRKRKAVIMESQANYEHTLDREQFLRVLNLAAVKC